MKRILSLLICFSIIFSCIGVHGEGFRVPVTPEENKYIVVLDIPPLYSKERVSFYNNGTDDSGAYRQALLEQQEYIKAQIPIASTFSLRGKAKKEYSYTDVLNGFTVTCNSETAELIRKIDGVKSVFKDVTFLKSEPVGTEEASFAQASGTEEAIEYSEANAGNMIKVQYAYNEGYKGQGCAVAIIDGGIDVEHSYYTITDTQTPLKYSYQDIENIISNGLNVTATAEAAWRNDKIPFAYHYAKNSAVLPSDTHGGHVAGIAAGGSVNVENKKISGIAPEAQILFFNVFNDEGGAAFSDIVAAIEDATKFKVDAINLSLGASNASENNADDNDTSETNVYKAYQEMTQNAKNAGCSVQFAAGNDDRLSYQAAYIDYSTADNLTYKQATKVGSVQNNYAYMPYLEDEAGNKYPCDIKGKTSTLQALPVVNCPHNATTEELQALGVKDKIAVITIPDSFIAEAIRTYGARAYAAGAAAVIIINNSVDVANGSLGADYPLFLVSKQTGKEILDTATTLKFENKKAVLLRSEEILANKFSSYGNSDSLDITVDYSAVGGNIYSAYGSGFGNLSGTSMATPQATGAAVLMHQYVKENFPAYQNEDKVMLIKKLLASTAETVYTEDGKLESPRKVGSGLIQLDRAMSTNIILKSVGSDESKISLGDGIDNYFEVKFVAENLSNESITFNKVDVELSTDDYKQYTNGYGICETLGLTPKTIEAPETVTIPANSSSEVTVKITLSEEDINYLSIGMSNGFFIDGKITLSESTNCKVGIPFLGFRGNWCKMLPITRGSVANQVYFATDDGYGFAPNMKLFDENNQLVLPVSSNPVGDFEASVVKVKGNPYRNCLLTVKIDGEEIIKDEFLNKTYLYEHELKGLSVADLVSAKQITIELRHPYDTLGENIVSYTINVIKDDILPHVTDIYSSTVANNLHANVVVSDNYNVGVITAIGTYTGDGEVYIIDDKYVDSRSATKSINIDGFKDIYYIVYDGAMNAVMVEPKVLIYVSGDKAVFMNNTTNQVSGTCMIAVYGDKNKMEEFKELAPSQNIGAYGEAKFDISDYAGKKYKLFFWQDRNNTYAPVCDNYSTN